LPSETAVRTFSMSAGLEASTVTPGSTAPEVSLIEPAMTAWANAAAGRVRRDPATRRNRTARIEYLMVRLLPTMKGFDFA
jgi:hypothetical protein